MRKARRTACMPNLPCRRSIGNFNYLLLAICRRAMSLDTASRASRCLDDPHKNLRTTYVFHNTLMSYYISHFANCTLQIAANLSISLKITKYLNVFYSAI